jgi:hypothetical protein
MASHWPVIVGINQYESLQPLLYAQFDAIELRDFLVHEAGLPPQYCALLTDISPMVYQGAAFPSREVILKRLAQTVNQTAEGDTVWFFFSGYGVHWEGEDYILPIDADPNRIAQTGILVETLFQTLKAGQASQTLVILDINRPQSALAPMRLGQQSLELAKSLSVPLLLSCQPNEFSQETLAVRHGLFTEAMIEGMRFHGCLTLTQLTDYLVKRLPELCRQYWRPEQHPAMAIPPEQKFLMLVPPSAAGQLPSIPLPQPDEPAVISPPSNGGNESAVPPEIIVPEPELPDGTENLQPEGEPPVVGLSPAESGNGGAPVTPGPASPLPAEIPSIPDVGGTITPPESDSTPSTSSAWGWPQWGLLTAGLLLLGVLLRNQTVFWNPSSPLADSNGTAEPAVPPAGEASSGELASSPEPAPPDSAPPAANPEAVFPGGTIDPAKALELARTALAEQQFGEALTWLNQIPEDQRPEDYATLLAEAEAGYASSVVTGEAVLNEARRMVEPVPASLFNDAIERARQVPVGDPEYEQAQADIARWSRVILDLAEGRAASGNFDGAIAAARLVPEDQAEVRAQAQEQITRWQQRQVNRQLLQQAQGLLQPDQATSFRDAIAVAQQIPPDYPESATAQERIDQWSQDILVIARARAAAGQTAEAIAAANLVPAGTSAYDQAQQEIQRWQGQ